MLNFPMGGGQIKEVVSFKQTTKRRNILIITDVDKTMIPDGGNHK